VNTCKGNRQQQQQATTGNNRQQQATTGNNRQQQATGNRPQATGRTAVRRGDEESLQLLF
jgi:hypothetical protein